MNGKKEVLFGDWTVTHGDQGYMWVAKNDRGTGVYEGHEVSGNGTVLRALIFDLLQHRRQLKSTPGNWYFEHMGINGTLLAIEPDETRHLVKHGTLTSPAGEKLIQAMMNALSTQAEPKAIARHNAMEIQSVLNAVQDGEISTGRARELIEMWLAGTYKNDELPTFDHLLDEDDIPVEIIAKLKAEVVQLKDLVRRQDESHIKQCDEIGELSVQNRKLRQALGISAGVFRLYQAHHLAKDDAVKAQRNEELAEMCEAALGR